MLQYPIQCRDIPEWAVIAALMAALLAWPHARPTTDSAALPVCVWLFAGTDPRLHFPLGGTQKSWHWPSDSQAAADLHSSTRSACDWLHQLQRAGFLLHGCASCTQPGVGRSHMLPFILFRKETVASKCVQCCRPREAHYCARLVQVSGLTH